MKKNNNKTVIISVVFSFTLILSVLLSILGTSAYYNYLYASDDNFSKIYKVQSEIYDRYYSEIDESVLNEGAVKGMMESLDDPYSSYMTPEEAEEFRMALENQYVGIGVQIELNNETAYIAKIFEGTPASKSGLAVGDVFASVDGVSVIGNTTSEIASVVRGEAGTEVEIGVLRSGEAEELVFTITRAAYELDSLKYKMLESGVGYIQIIDFTSDIYSQVDDAYNDLSSQKMTSLIIDVRDNGGGYLDQVIKITDMFVDDSKPIYQERFRDKIVYEEFGEDDKKDIEVAVLINDYSASASELLAAALNEINGSELIGTTTFGKGTAQTSINLGDGSELKLTFAQWLTPNGNWIHKVGIAPTVEVELDELFYYRNVYVSEPLKFDLVSMQVESMQRIISVLGYDVRTDGYYDNDTVEAIKDFQSKNGLTVTGEVDASTALEINSQFEKFKEDYQNDNQIMEAIEVLTDE